MFLSIEKRNGILVPFNPVKITTAILRAGETTGEFGEEVAHRLMLRVLSLAQQALPREIPSVEKIQDIVEEVLLSSQYKRTAKAYIPRELARFPPARACAIPPRASLRDSPPRELARFPFYINSSQLPVQYSDDVFKVLALHDELQTKYTGWIV